MANEYQRMSIDDLLNKASHYDKVEVCGRPNFFTNSKNNGTEFYAGCLISKTNKMVIISGQNTDRELLNDLNSIESAIKDSHNLIVQGVYETMNTKTPHLKVDSVSVSAKTKDEYKIN